MRRRRRGRAWRRVQLLCKGFREKLRRMYIRVVRMLQRVFLAIAGDFRFFFGVYLPLKNLQNRGFTMNYEGGHIRSFARCIAIALLLGFLPTIASAYTLVLRDGRRVEIPNNFTVSQSTLTYEISPGFQKTLLLDSIDIPATERINNEPAGAFLKRTAASTPAISREPARRAITNRDLESFKQKRLQNEAAYDRRRKELGLPSMEETRREAQAEADRAFDQILEIRSRQAESESYWRSRASELRAEIAATNARIDFVRARLNEIPVGPAFGVFSTALPFGLTGHSRFGNTFPRQSHRPLVFSARGAGPQIRGRIGIGRGHFRSHIRINPAPRFHGARRGFSGFPLLPVLSIPFQDYDSSYERSELIVQLDELLSHRAGLQARWRDLEDEARRAGVAPGWLRP